MIISLLAQDCKESPFPRELGWGEVVELGMWAGGVVMMCFPVGLFSMIDTYLPMH